MRNYPSSSNSSHTPSFAHKVSTYWQPQHKRCPCGRNRVCAREPHFPIAIEESLPVVAVLENLRCESFEVGVKVDFGLLIQGPAVSVLSSA